MRSRRKTLTSDLPPPPSQNDVIHHADNGGNQYEEDQPKLAEGFYVIEALRKKRVRKGVKQYLIKWRGWPESANTWEPVESLTSCLDLVEEFESSTSGKRKRKRKHSAGPLSQSKKKQQQQQQQQQQQDSSVNNSNGLDSQLIEVKENTTPDFAIHIQEDPAEPANGASKVDETKFLRASPRIGARRRKSCAVKRFNKELNSISKQDFTKKTTAADDDDVVNNGLVSANILDTPQKVCVITKILKPVNYSISVLNDTEEVCVSFLVMRSDGEEIVVDNKYLKENNPVLLINFYEQHLRYNSSSE